MSMAEFTAPDSRQRETVLDPARSFIVQAPAGSGKTTLLAQRFVSLLGHVERPEEILAITFTKKAAAEMRHRVLTLLGSDLPIARAARQRAQSMAWDIASNPNVLKIQTIDSFALDIASQTPQLEISTGIRIVEQGRPFYEAATERLLQSLYQRDDTAALVADFLAFVDNDARSASNLLTYMLSRRDQWLDPVRGLAASSDPAITGTLLNTAASSVREAVESEIERRLDADDKDMLTKLAAVTGCLDEWDTLFDMLRTAQGGLRKRLTVKDGIDDAGLKREFNQWLASLHQRGLASLIVSHGQLPARTVSDSQQSTLRLVCVILALAAAELETVLRRERVLDFTGLLLRAKSALRDEDGPTDLALFLDYRIRHVLVDEYQDTSRAQLDFFNLLTEGWTADGRNTFFAVGDPMQSIYRFRDADVSIFADGLSRGLDNVPLEPINLHANFRADPHLVNWSNRKFSELFAPTGVSAAQLGEVSYHSATPVVTGNPEADVRNWRFFEQTEETIAVAKHIQQLLARDQSASIAVLCRARPHVSILLELLSDQNIDVQATDMDLLAEKPVIRDLGNLHSVLLSETEELAWFATLRAPFCGLTLAQLLDMRDAGITSADRLLSGEVMPFPQLERLHAALRWARSRLYELPLREVLEGCWFRLGAADAYSPEALTHADAWFDLVEDMQTRAYDSAELGYALGELYADTSTEAQVQVMTIHKAKGLEFDHVILPYLHRVPRRDDPQLLMWRAGAPGLLMGARGDSVHEWLSFEERQRAQNEDKRILYVGCTRAKQTLLLTHTCEEDKKPTGLARWLADAEPMDRGTDAAASPAVSKLQTDLFQTQSILRRLPAGYAWQPPAYLASPGETTSAVTRDPIGGRTEVNLGNLVHRALAWFADTGGAALADLPAHLERWCEELEIPDEQKSFVSEQALTHLERTRSDPSGAWVLEAHQEACAELPLTGVVDGDVQNVVLDRMFVADGYRWIVDYKTAEPVPDENVEGFVARELARYRPQLELYARVAGHLYPEPVKTALYFTALGRLTEFA